MNVGLLLPIRPQRRKFEARVTNEAAPAAAAAPLAAFNLGQPRFISSPAHTSIGRDWRPGIFSDAPEGDDSQSGNRADLRNRCSKAETIAEPLHQRFGSQVRQSVAEKFHHPPKVDEERSSKVKAPKQRRYSAIDLGGRRFCQERRKRRRSLGFRVGAEPSGLPSPPAPRSSGLT